MRYPNVMISSTIDDLEEYRNLVQECLRRSRLNPVSMDSIVPGAGRNSITSSMELVDHSEALICIVGARYGTIHRDAELNPDNLSISELEFRKAIDNRIPVLSFILADDAPVLRSHIERDPEKIEKLDRYLELIRKDPEGSGAEPIVCVFRDQKDFISTLSVSVEQLKASLNRTAELASQPLNSTVTTDKAEAAVFSANEFDPYPGLAPLDERFANVIQGRELEIEWLQNELRTGASNIMLFGNSGVGKSSLVRAGLLPRISELYHCETIIPRANPAQELQSS